MRREETARYGETLPDGRPYHAAKEDGPRDWAMVAFIAIFMILFVVASMMYSYVNAR